MTPADTTKYRRIDIPAGAESAVQLDQAISALNRHFDPQDFTVARADSTVNVWLRKVDLAVLSDATKAVVATFGDSHAVSAILPAVSRIGSYGVSGSKRQYVDYNKERKVRDRKEKERRRGKHYYAADHTFADQANPLPNTFRNQVVCGDAEFMLKELPDSCIDLVFTSPPYNFGLGYAGDAGDDATDWESYFEKLFRVLDECIRVLKFGGRLVVNVQPLFSDYIPSHHIISNHLMKRRLIWKGEILWEKNNYNCKYTAWGSWKSPSSPYLKYTWEFLEVFCKGDLRKRGNPKDADISTESFKEWVVAKWSIAPERRMRELGHPAVFPEELARRVVQLFSFRGDIVLDPFVGSGTTCVAARRHRRCYLGIDLSHEYCAVARRRLADVEVSML